MCFTRSLDEANVWLILFEPVAAAAGKIDSLRWAARGTASGGGVSFSRGAASVDVAVSASGGCHRPSKDGTGWARRLSINAVMQVAGGPSHWVTIRRLENARRR